MADLSLTGTLRMVSACIDWRAETARCIGLFRTPDGGSLEVEYRVPLGLDLLDLLAQAFLKAGLPTLNAPSPEPVKMAVPSGVVEVPDRRIDKRSREWKLLQRKMAEDDPTNGHNVSQAPVAGEKTCDASA